MPTSKFVYLICRDFLSALIIVYFFTIVPELILPGIVSPIVSPKHLLSVILILGFVTAYLAKKGNLAIRENIQFKSISHSLISIILFIITILIVLSLYQMRWWQIIFTTLLSIILLIYMQKMLIIEE